MYATKTVCRDYTRRRTEMGMMRLSRLGRRDARDDGRESVGRKAERHGRWNPRLTVERYSHGGGAIVDCFDYV